MKVKLKVDCPNCGKLVDMGDIELKENEYFDMESVSGVEVECDCGIYKYVEIYWKDC